MFDFLYNLMINLLGSDVIGVVNKPLIASIFTYIIIAIFCCILLLFVLSPLLLLIALVNNKGIKKWLD